MKLFKDNKAKSNRNALKGGSYAITISTIVLAILIVVNILVTNLPKTMTSIDIGAVDVKKDDLYRHITYMGHRYPDV